jgi:dihydroorotate dehydrogenase
MLRRNERLWSKLRTPLILALSSASGPDWPAMAALIDEHPCISGVQLQIGEGAESSDLGSLLESVRRSTTLPLLVALPDADCAELAATCAKAGVDALVLGIPPLGAWPIGEVVLQAPVSGPVAFAFTLRALRTVSSLDLGLPLVASGGITNEGNALFCLTNGATAVQLRSLFWTDPNAARVLAQSLGAHNASPTASSPPK